MTWKALGDYRGPMRAGAFMRYATQAHKDSIEELAYRMYVCESMRLRAEGKYITQRYLDIIRPAEDFDAQAVVERVILQAGLEVIHESA